MNFLTSAKIIALGTLVAGGITAPALAAELVMVERPGCHYCIEWKEVIGPIYPKTDAGKFAPLKVVDISESAPFEGGYTQPIIYTPTFVIVDNGQEVGRILGYTGEHFFWPVLEGLLEHTTQFMVISGS